MIEYVFLSDFLWAKELEDKISDVCQEILHESVFSDISLTVVFGSDDWLLAINKKFLNHDYYTDIITFDYCEGSVLAGELCISLNQVEFNANRYNVPRETELLRVAIHGVLHLIGYNDQTEDDKSIMREKEDYYLLLVQD